MTLKEAQIQAACCEILELDDWRRVRTDMPHLRGLGVQEKGIADDLFIRYANDNPYTRTANGYRGDAPDFKPRQWAEVLWCEWKRTTARTTTKAKQHQKDWHELERKRGAKTVIAGEDFPADVDGFIAWYRASGLMRRKIL